MPVNLGPFFKIVGVSWGTDVPEDIGLIGTLSPDFRDLLEGAGPTFRWESGYAAAGWPDIDLVPMASLGSFETSPWWDALFGEIIRFSILWNSNEGMPDYGSATFEFVFRTKDQNGAPSPAYGDLMTMPGSPFVDEKADPVFLTGTFIAGDPTFGDYHIASAHVTFPDDDEDGVTYAEDAKFTGSVVCTLVNI